MSIGGATASVPAPPEFLVVALNDGLSSTLRAELPILFNSSEKGFIPSFSPISWPSLVTEIRL